MWRHIQNITDTYRGDLPLTHFLKGYFRQHPILGSRDRRILSAMAYSWYRVHKGLAHAQLPYPEAMLACLTLCHAITPGMERMLQDVALPDVDRLFRPDALYDGQNALSEGISKQDWLNSMRVQPMLFVRIRHQSYVRKALAILLDNGVEGTAEGNCIALPNGAPIEKLLPADSYVVQDASSQATGRWLDAKPGQRWWDCCSGAGGKSLLLADQCSGIQLTVSDTRPSILHNLEERFRLYGHKIPTTAVADATDAYEIKEVTGGKQYDRILCDVPCTGSGTWARTPEQMYFFDPAAVADFAARQQAILNNVSKYLAQGGKLFYITCSVFAQENEEVAKNGQLKVTNSQLINGITQRADSMYIAVLQHG